MFGLTKREQRWAAELKAAEIFFDFAAVAIQAAASVRVAEIQKCPHCGKSPADENAMIGENQTA